MSVLGSQSGLVWVGALGCPEDKNEKERIERAERSRAGRRGEGGTAIRLNRSCWSAL